MQIFSGTRSFLLHRNVSTKFFWYYEKKNVWTNVVISFLLRRIQKSMVALTYVEYLRKLNFKLWSRFFLFANVDQIICILAKNMPVLAGRLVIRIPSIFCLLTINCLQKGLHTLQVILRPSWSNSGLAFENLVLDQVIASNEFFVFNFLFHSSLEWSPLSTLRQQVIPSSALSIICWHLFEIAQVWFLMNFSGKVDIVHQWSHWVYRLANVISDIFLSFVRRHHRSFLLSSMSFSGILKHFIPWYHL